MTDRCPTCRRRRPSRPVGATPLWDGRLTRLERIALGLFFFGLAFGWALDLI